MPERFPEYTRGLEVGQRVKGMVVAYDLSEGILFIDYGGKSEGYVQIDEFLYKESPYPDPEAAARALKGKAVEAFFIGNDRDIEQFSIYPGLQPVPFGILRDCYNKQLPILGRILDNKGDLWHVRVANKTATITPAQFHPDHRWIDDPVRPGNVYMFYIAQIDRGLSLTRRPIFEREREEQIERSRRQIQIGDVLKIKVKEVFSKGLRCIYPPMPYLRCFIPASEVAHGRRVDPTKELSVGEEIRAEVIDKDWEKGELVLSRKKVLPNPWKENLTFKEGEIVEGEIKKIMPYGIFFQVGVLEGLVPGRESGFPKGTRLEKHFRVGEKRSVYVLEIDREAERITLSLRKAAESADQKEMERYIERYQASEGGESFGDLLKKSLKQVGKP